MKEFLFLLEKECLQILRNKVIMAMIIVLPCFQIAFLPYAATFKIKNINLCVIDHDGSSKSKELINKIDNSNFFTVKYKEYSFEKALSRVENEEASLILDIPRGFAKNLEGEHSGKLAIYADGIDGGRAAIATSYLNGIVNEFSSGVFEAAAGAAGAGAAGGFAAAGANAGGSGASGEHFEAAGVSAQTQSLLALQSIPTQSNISYRYNPLGDYKVYMMPVLIVMLISLMGGILTALNIVSERENGTLEQINVSPVRKYNYILAKIIPFQSLSMILLTLDLIIVYFVYGISSSGSIALLYLFAFLYSLAFNGFGMMISISAKNQQQSMFIAFFFLLIFFLLGDMFTPISSMPKLAQYITYLNPTAYMNQAFKLIMIKGSGFFDLGKQFAAICFFVLLFNALAVAIYRKSE